MRLTLYLALDPNFKVEYTKVQWEPVYYEIGMEALRKTVSMLALLLDWLTKNIYSLVPMLHQWLWMNLLNQRLLLKVQ